LLAVVCDGPEMLALTPCHSRDGDVNIPPVDVRQWRDAVHPTAGLARIRTR
jgi:hypothetical protein